MISPKDAVLNSFKDAVRLSQVGKLLPRNGKEPFAPSTAWRWVKQGVRGRNGERIRLNAFYVGRTPMVTLAAVKEFIAQVTAARQPQEAKGKPNSRPDSTSRRLRDAGLL